jgi:hypothetical protein
MMAALSRKTRLFVVCFAIGALILLALYACYPRRADLTAFDPGAMARAETLMWRHYYEKRYPQLFLDLYGVARGQQGFSPLDSVRISFLAARAANSFQPSRSRREADAALPDLIAYYALLARAAPVPVDVRQAARTELDWWQARRENISPDAYGLTIARVSTLLYGVDNDDSRRAGILRAQAMAYRDAHGSVMTEADWGVIAGRLSASYRLLKQAIASKPR